MSFFSRKEEVKEQEPIIECENVNATYNEAETIPVPNSLPKEDVNLAIDFLAKHYGSPSNKVVSQLLANEMTYENFIKDVVNALYSYTPKNPLTAEDRTLIAEEFHKSISGYRIIDPLLNDDTISDIKIHSYDNIRIKQLGVRKTSDIKFESLEDYLTFVSLIKTKNKVNLGNKNAIQKFVDKKSCDKAILRFNITTEFVNSNEQPCIHIRKTLKTKKTIDKLVEEKMITPEQKEYLCNAVRNKRGILFAGKGASGKTTLMNALLPIIPYDKSGLVIQEAEELFDNDHPDLMFQHIIQNRGEGSIGYELKDFTINGLLVDLDYIIIGEIKGEEAAYLMNASYTGHICWCSVHGVNSKEALDKLADYATYNTSYSKTEIMNMLQYIETVVFLKDYKVAEISEVSGFDHNTGRIEYRQVF